MTLVHISLVVFSLSSLAQDPDSLPSYYGDKEKGNFYLRENDGQVHDTDGDPVTDVGYYVENTPVGIYLRDKSTVSFTMAAVDLDTATVDTLYRVDMEFGHGNDRDPEHTGDPVGGVNNYYRHQVSVEEVEAYTQGVYRSVWDSINVYFYSSLGGPRMAIAVMPGGDPADISLKFNGQDSIGVDWQGALRLYVGERWIELQEAMAYQVDGNNNVIPVTWLMEYDYVDGNAFVNFEFYGYNTSRPLVFQIGYPPMPAGGGGSDNFCWSTYFGGSGNVLSSTEVDDDGGLYVAGYTDNDNFPATVGTTVNPGPSTFSGTVAKFNSAYQILWATYYGGANHEEFKDIAYNAYGDDLFGVGYTLSPDLLTPYSSGEYHDGSLNGNNNTTDAFMCRLNAASGILEWGTYFGGIGGDRAYSVACDANGAQYVVGGGSDGLDLQGWGTAYLQAFAGVEDDPFSDGDAFIVRFDNTQDLTWCTYVGGAYAESFSATDLDDEGNIFVIGQGRTGFPQIDDCGSLVSNGPQGFDDCVLCKFDATGHLCWSTLAGGLANDIPAWEGAVAVGNGRVYFGANSSSLNFPTLDLDDSYYQEDNAGFGDGVLMCFDLSTLDPIWMTYVGGTGWDYISGIDTDTWGNLYVTGYSKSADMPLVELTGAYYQEYAGGGSNAAYGDAFIASYTYPQHSPTWLTMVGGGPGGLNDGDGAESIVADGHDRLFIAGTSTSYSPPYPTHNPGNGAYFGSTFATGTSVITCFDLSAVPVSTPEVLVTTGPGLTLVLDPDQSRVSAFVQPAEERIVEVFDVSGRAVATLRLAAGARSIAIPIGHLSSGAYVVNVHGAGGTFLVERFVKP